MTSVSSSRLRTIILKSFLDFVISLVSHTNALIIHCTGIELIYRIAVSCFGNIVAVFVQCN